MKLLITGATGFVGKSFIAEFKGEYEIHALVRQTSSLSISGINAHEYDGTIHSIKNALDGIDVVLHLATCYKAAHCEIDILPMLEANVIFGVQLLEAMHQTNVNRIVNVGTTWQKFECEHYNYANLYSATKQAFQELLKFYVDANQWHCVNLHFNDTYGKDDHRKKIIQLLIESAKNSTSLDMSLGEQRFETCYISDAIKALDITIERVIRSTTPSNEEFSILTGDDTSLRELVDTVERILVTPLKINWGARPYRDREVMSVPYSNYKTLPNWEKKVSLQDGIKKLL
ncbi:NAD-dependent epimerase/dehydratase family protein [Vibrio breoganii]|uniref:NAD-dependent epimerase/dehydratase family protein n=1 Tax=Vibrio breoganii TaxID=553239 RepID=UPI000C81AE24|nr:NAD(P)-dependent oxidoreductase [Vibrio breoganii]